jgi:molecular chaperone Hsp33
MSGGVAGGPTIPDSCLYTFIDDAREFALYFLEGQRLIQDLALLHPIRRAGFAYFRDVVLSIQPMIALLKHGEQFGFYIDSDEPYFRLKIETGHQGATRCMLLPEYFREFPEAMRGIVRMYKFFPNNKPPYESVLEAEALPLREIVNHVLQDSYQVHCATLVSPTSDQSLLLHQLPPLRTEEYDYSQEAVQVRRAQIRETVEQIFARSLHRPAEIETAFVELGFRPLASRPVRFKCSCSRERMIGNLRAVYRTEGKRLFDPGDEALEVTCEYCKQRYRIPRECVERDANSVN